MEGTYKQHRIWGNLPVCGVVETCRHIENEEWAELLLRDHFATGQLDIVPNYPDRTLLWEEDSKSVPHALTHIPANGYLHIRCEL